MGRVKTQKTCAPAQPAATPSRFVGKKLFGQMSPEDEERMLNHEDDTVRAQYQRMKEESEEIQKLMSPPGALGLPPLLEQRRLECGIIDAAFEKVAQFDRLYIFQHDAQQGGEYIDGGKIVMPDTFKEQRQEQSPRGVIVSAGIHALDTMRSHGWALGDYVELVKSVLWKLPIGRKNLREVRLLCCRIGDVAGNEDVRERYRTGEIKLVWTPEVGKHLMQWRNEPPLEPMEPFKGEDY